MDVVRREPQRGWIEVITGSMFSGKSEELIRRLRRAQIARQKVQIFKPISTTASATTTSSRTATCASRRRTSPNSDELVRLVDDDTEVVGIDEGQFFDADLPAACNTLADRGKRVIVAGLDQDYLGRPFEPMPQLLAIAEYITKTLAICVVCGDPANHTQRLVASSDRVLVGAERPLRGALPPLLRSRAGRRRDSWAAGTLTDRSLQLSFATVRISVPASSESGSPRNRSTCVRHLWLNLACESARPDALGAGRRVSGRQRAADPRARHVPAPAPQRAADLAQPEAAVLRHGARARRRARRAGVLQGSSCFGARCSAKA